MINQKAMQVLINRAKYFPQTVNFLNTIQNLVLVQPDLLDSTDSKALMKSLKQMLAYLQTEIAKRLPLIAGNTDPQEDEYISEQSEYPFLESLKLAKPKRTNAVKASIYFKTVHDRNNIDYDCFFEPNLTVLRYNMANDSFFDFIKSETDSDFDSNSQGKYVIFETNENKQIINKHYLEFGLDKPQSIYDFYQYRQSHLDHSFYAYCIPDRCSQSYYFYKMAYNDLAADCINKIRKQKKMPLLEAETNILKLSDASAYLYLIIRDRAAIDLLKAYKTVFNLLDNFADKISAYLNTLLLNLIRSQQAEFDYSVKSKITNEDLSKIEFNQKATPSMRELLNNLTLPEDDNKQYGKATLNSQLWLFLIQLMKHQPLDTDLFNLVANGVGFDKIKYQQAINLKLADKAVKLTDAQKDKVLKQIPIQYAKKVKQVYQIKQNFPYQAEYGHHFTLAHGTDNISVLNILGQGLMPHHNLIENGIKNYHYTASALGDGVYFSRLSQIAKSFNYTDSDENLNHYLFICDVYYHDIEDVNAYYTNTDTNKDLVWAHGVGSNDYDELLAKNAEQIQLKYLLVWQ